MSKEKSRNLEKRQRRLEVMKDKVLNLKQERIEKLQTELLEGLDFDTTGWNVQWSYSRVEILGAVILKYLLEKVMTTLMGSTFPLSNMIKPK